MALDSIAQLDADLRSFIATATGRPCGLAALPTTGDTDANGNPEPPYSILYPIPGGSAERGRLSRERAFTTVAYQLTVVALDPSGARDVAGDAEAAIEGTDPISGTVNVTGRQGQPGGSPGGITREGTLWNATAIYEITVT